MSVCHLFVAYVLWLNGASCWKTVTQIQNGLWPMGIEWSRDRWRHTVFERSGTCNMLQAQYLENSCSWRFYLATIAHYETVSCEAVLSTLLVTIWLLAHRSTMIPILYRWLICWSHRFLISSHSFIFVYFQLSKRNQILLYYIALNIAILYAYKHCQELFPSFIIINPNSQVPFRVNDL